MIDRRTLLQSGAALTAAAALPGAAAFAAIGAGAGAPLRLERFMLDNRFADAVITARHAASLGIPLAEFSGNLTHLWYDELDLQWRKAPMTFAGITSAR